MYRDVLIRDGNINQGLKLIAKNLPESSTDFEIESDGELETSSNHLSVHRHAANEPLIVENDNLRKLDKDQDKAT